MTAYTNKRKTRKEEEEEKDRLNQMTAVRSLTHSHTHTQKYNRYFLLQIFF